MKTIKKKAAFYSALVLFSSLALAPVQSASAATSWSNWFSRGVKNVSYVKTTFSWCINEDWLIDRDKTSINQYASGVFASGGGYWFLSGNGIDDYWAVLSTVGFTVEFLGGNIFPSSIHEDHVIIDNAGGFELIPDVG